MNYSKCNKISLVVIPNFIISTHISKIKKLIECNGRKDLNLKSDFMTQRDAARKEVQAGRLHHKFGSFYALN